jgi:hypothetical protein
MIGVGRASCVPGPPSLRTGQADFPHPALQLVVLPQRGPRIPMRRLRVGEQPTIGLAGSGPANTPPRGDLGRRAASQDGSSRVPQDRACPTGLALAGTRGRWRLRLAGSHVSTFLHPFARRELPRFFATMGVLTPGRLSSPPRSPCFACRTVLTVPPPTTPCLRCRRFDTRFGFSSTARPLGLSAAGVGFAFHSQARRDTWPNRVRHPADRSFTSWCSPPRLAATQFQFGCGPEALGPEGTCTPLT